MEDDRLGKTLAITSLYPENRIRNSRSSLCAFRRSLGETRSSRGATRAAPILARPSTPASAPSSTHGYYPRRGLEPAARNPHPQQDCLQPTQPHYLRLWGQGLRTPVLFVPRYVVLLD